MKSNKKIVVVMVVAILVLSISPIHGALTNPYENWIETKDLKNCTISFMFIGTYVDSKYGPEHLFDGYGMRFENGKFDSANNTFSVSSATETYGEFDTDIKRILKKECKVVFDSGANNIKSFSALVADDYSNSMGDFCEEEISIKGSGPSFPFSKEILYFSGPDPGLTWTDPERGLGWTDSAFAELGWVIDMENTSYNLWGEEEGREYVKNGDIVKRRTCLFKNGTEYETWTRELTGFEFDEESVFLQILFNGYLPRLRDNEGFCSWFGGPDDTGIDVTWRKQFYEERFEGTYDSKIFKQKQVSDEFDAWMNEMPKSRWEGTGLGCGPARELDTKNDYFCAMRWHNKEIERYNYPGKPGSQDWWREQKIKVTNTVNNKSVVVAPVDWGPNVTTNRTIDLSEKAIKEINATTDDTWVEMCIVDSDTSLGLVTNQ